MRSDAHRLFPLAYHLTLHGYGLWPPGDPRGWHRRGDGPRSPSRPGDEVIVALSRELQHHPTVTITEATRLAVVQAISTLAIDRRWRLHEVATTSSHLHAVIGAPMKGVDVLDLVRGETHRALIDQGLVEPGRPFWSAGGSFSMVHTVRGLERVCRYVALHRREEVADDVIVAPSRTRR